MTSTTDSFAPTTTPTRAWQAWVPVAGRVVYAAPFAVFGLFHFAAADQMAAIVPVPGGVFWVYLTGVALLAASISLITGKLAKIAAPLLALLIGTFVVTLHLPATGAEGAAGQQAVTSLLKDTALLGAALLAWADALRRG